MSEIKYYTYQIRKIVYIADVKTIISREHCLWQKLILTLLSLYICN